MSHSMHADDDLIGSADRRSTLEELFLQHLPNYARADGKGVDYKVLADDLSLTRQAVHLWFSRERISYQQLQNLVDLPGSTFTLEILYPLCLAED